MPTFSPSHSEARSKVCAICYKKSSWILTALFVHLIQIFVNPTYNYYDPIFANGICSTCERVLYQNSKPTTTAPTLRTLQIHELATKGVTLLPITRGTCCTCSICTEAKKRGRKTKPKVGRPRYELNSIFFHNYFILPVIKEII